MESATLKQLVQQLKEKEEQDIVYSKKIKENETIIKAEEDNIKHLKSQKTKLTEELERKILESSKTEIDLEILQKQLHIWRGVMENTQKEFKEQQTTLDALMQSVYLNRISFCDNTKEFLNKHDILKMSCGFMERPLLPIITDKALKKEENMDEYNKLLEHFQSLEAELKELEDEESQIEEAKKLKLQLQNEPSSGEQFLRLQHSLKDMKDTLQNLEIRIKTVKSEIAEKELLILNNNNKINNLKPQTSQVLHQNFHTGHHATTVISANDENAEINNASNIKIVKFKEAIRPKQIPASPQLKSILKSRTLIAKSPSSTLIRKISQEINSKLDDKMKDIIFRRN